MIVTHMCARFIIGKINALLNRAERMHSISGKPALNYRAACSNWSVYTILTQELGNIFKRSLTIKEVLDTETVFKCKVFLVDRDKFTHNAPFTAVRGALERIPHKYERVNV